MLFIFLIFYLVLLHHIVSHIVSTLCVTSCYRSNIILIGIKANTLIWLGKLYGFLYILFKMDNAKYEGFMNRSLILDGTHYDYWKARLVSFLKSMNCKTWKSIIKGWTPLKITTKDNTGNVKPQKDWTTIEDEEALWNYRAFNTIYKGVDKNIFIIINTCTSAKEVWETLEVAHKLHPKFICQNFNFSQQNLKTQRWRRKKLSMNLMTSRQVYR